MKTYGVVLAAGFGVRMGAPKISLKLARDRVPLVVRHVERFFEVGCARVIVVARPQHLAFVGEAELVRAETCSQGCSLAAALATLAASESGDRVLVTPVDVEPASRATIERLGRACDDHDAATPSHDHCGGHPVLVSRAIVDAKYTYTCRAPGHVASPALRDVLRALGDRRLHVDVDEPTVRFDFDVPADLARTGSTIIAKT